MKLSQAQIFQILPHRDPFLHVDLVERIDLENKEIIGIKKIDLNDEVFNGHFPDHPIYPGVLLIESMAQTSGILGALLLARETTVTQEQDASTLDTLVAKVGQSVRSEKIFLGESSVRFLSSVRPGDQVLTCCHLIRINSYALRFSVLAKVDGKIKAKGSITLARVPAVPLPIGAS